MVPQMSRLRMGALALGCGLLLSGCSIVEKAIQAAVSPAEGEPTSALPDNIDTGSMSWEQVAEAAAVRAKKSGRSAADLYRIAIDKAKKAGAPPAKILNLIYNDGVMLHDWDYPYVADSLYKEGLEIAVKNKLDDWQATFLVQQALNDRSLVRAGIKKSLDAAPVELALRLRPGEADVPTTFRGEAYMCLGRVADARGDVAAGEKYFEQAREQFIGAGNNERKLRYANEGMLELFAAHKLPDKAAHFYNKVGKETPQYRWHFYEVYRDAQPLGTVDNTGVREKVGAFIKAKDFVGLDTYAASLRPAVDPMPLGDYPIDRLILYFYLKEDDECGKAMVESAKAWLAARPNSDTARIALANAYAAWAWVARGSGWADTVTENGWKVFGERLQEAKKVLDTVIVKTPDYYYVYERVAMGLSEDNNARTAEGVKKYPHNKRMVAAKFWQLQPRWGGAEGDDMKFLNERLAASGAVEGDMLYARIALEEAGIFPNVYKDGHFDKARVRDGLKAMREKYPGSPVARIASIFMAMEADDADLAQTLADGK